MGHRSRGAIPAVFMDKAAQRRESVCPGNRCAGDADRLVDESFHDLVAETRELVLHRASLWIEAFEIRQSGEDAGHDLPEECRLPGKVTIDRRLARRRRLGDLV